MYRIIGVEWSVFKRNNHSFIITQQRYAGVLYLIIRREN